MPPKHVARLLLWALLGTETTAARAAYDPDDAVNGYVEQSVRYDDNLQRLPANTQSPLAGGATTLETRLGGSLKQNLSRQRIELDGNVVQASYTSRHNLDYLGWMGAAAWYWQLGPSWSGQLAYTDQRSMSAFEDTPGGEKDLVRQRNGQVSASYVLNQYWTVLGSAGTGLQRHDSRGYLDLQQRTASSGVQLQTGRGSQLALMIDYLDVDYLRDYGSQPAGQRGYQQWFGHVDASWPITAKTTLTANWGMANWRYATDGDWRRSPLGGVGAIWQASEKSRLSLTYQRQFEMPGQHLERNVVDDVKFAFVWQASDTATLTTSWQRDRRTASTPLDYADTTDVWRLALDYTWRNAWLLSALMQFQRRDSALPDADFSSTQAGLNVRLRF
ncbi:hypothetical protein SAMN02745857_01516 [Andreprevotia lacus DSM 23236]|jgi:hypothetical protein|uniref:Exopolysaccharide biosynthesis operon protein EpsL n=1 Tax=Andreprevotia lacus DSM 23236 TaxID=1121001 RepID=A0A1W1XG79_9NEIS|nr:hypothetical protein [Andreprevotia lacus]SMC23006.1 hypothetical protein SAMN02745857_01516 [Andreprevotia lacus DSM 23236]